jgi:hypothetical protein
MLLINKEAVMFSIRHKILAAICLLVLVAGGASLTGHSIVSAQTNNLIWSQTWDNQSILGPSIQTRATSTALNVEIADDFDIGGTIERVVVSGYRDLTAPSNPVVYGVDIHFYEWLNGQPGALQAESFIATGDPGLVYDPVRPAQFDITLSTPFQTTGRHFISVQVVMDAGTLDGWYWESANSGAPRGATVFKRDNLAGGTWSSVQNSDGVFQLYGTVTAAPRIDSLSAATLNRSGRLRIFGANFGGTQGSSRVLINGLTSFVSNWTDTAITAYVPEAANLGTVSVTVLTAAGTSNTASLNVTARQPNAQMKWRFQMDAMYTVPRPAVGPDGTIYAVDVSNHLYALTPDGGLKWLVNGAGSKGVDVGADGTIYTGTEDNISAYNPNGTLKWRFTQNPRSNILLGPNVGPDGNIYAVATQGLGVLSLTPQGNLRWAIAEQYARPPIDYQQVVFGPNGNTNQLYFHANAHLAGVDLNGNRRFTYPDSLSTTNGDVQPVVGPDGKIYGALFPAQLGAFDANGNLLHAFFPTGVNDPPLNTVSAPDVGPDGVIYVAQNLSTLRAFNSTGTQRWALNENTIYDFLNINAQNNVLFVGGRVTYGAPGFFEAVSTSGSALWQLQLPHENGSYIIPYTRARFSADGQTAYAGTAGNSYATDPYSYIYALQVGTSVPPPTPTVTLTPVPTSDTVTITRAEYTLSRNRLRVNATSTSANATLSVYVTATGQFVGTLTNNGGGKYSGQFNWPTNPQNITVKNSLGGSAMKTVTVK